MKILTNIQLKNFDLLWRKYGTMEKNMIVRKKLGYYCKLYLTLVNFC